MNDMKNIAARNILKQERDTLCRQIKFLERQKYCITKFLADFPDATSVDVDCFRALVNHSTYDYETILDKLKLK